MPLSEPSRPPSDHVPGTASRTVIIDKGGALHYVKGQAMGGAGNGPEWEKELAQAKAASDKAAQDMAPRPDCGVCSSAHSSRGVADVF